jgi:hypothetical protein
MDLLSFQSACRVTARLMEREAPRSSEAAREVAELPENATQDQKNLQFLSRLRVHGG